jgi:hypothetical protein
MPHLSQINEAPVVEMEHRSGDRVAQQSERKTSESPWSAPTATLNGRKVPSRDFILERQILSQMIRKR